MINANMGCWPTLMHEFHKFFHQPWKLSVTPMSNCTWDSSVIRSPPDELSCLWLKPCHRPVMQPICPWLLRNLTVYYAKRWCISSKGKKKNRTGLISWSTSRNFPESHFFSIWGPHLQGCFRAWSPATITPSCWYPPPLQGKQRGKNTPLARTVPWKVSFLSVSFHVFVW